MRRFTIVVVLFASVFYSLEVSRYFTNIPRFLDMHSIISTKWTELTARLQSRNSLKPEALSDQSATRGVDLESTVGQQTPADLANALEEDARRSIISQDGSPEVVLQVDLLKEKTRSAALAERLVEVERSLAAAAAQIETLQKRLKAEGARSANTEGDLIDTRKKLTQATREASLGEDARRSLNAIVAADRAVLEIERTKSAQLASELEDVRSANTEGDLIDTRKKLVQATREASLGEDARRSLDAIVKADRAVLEMERTKSAQLASELEDTQRHASAHIEALRQEALRKRAALELPDSPGGSKPAQPFGPGAKPLAKIGAIPGSIRTLAASANVPSAPISLPEGVVARVVLRYARNSESARAHALNLGMTLRAQGLEVADPVAATADIAGDSVTFFYKEDKSNAKRIASVVVTSILIQNRPSLGGPLPPPGTIEVSVAS